MRWFALIGFLLSLPAWGFVASTPVTTGNSFYNFASATSVQVKTGAGTLMDICPNTSYAGATIDCYDGTSTSGKNMGLITQVGPTDVGATTDNITLLPCQTYGLGRAFTTGLYCVVTGNANWTVDYQ